MVSYLLRRVGRVIVWKFGVRYVVRVISIVVV